MIRKYTTYCYLSVFILLGTIVHAQENTIDKKAEHKALKAMREGNKSYDKTSYADAEYNYRTSSVFTDKNTDNAYNLGNAMLKQKRYKEAVNQYKKTLEATKDDQLQAQTYYNMGNAYMGLKDYQNAVNHYKESLKHNPNDEEARYNYALAKKFLKENPPQQNQDQNKDEQNQDQQNKDQQQDQKDQEQNKDKQDDQKQEDNKDKKDDKKDQQDQNKDNQQNQDQNQKNDQSDQNKEQNEQNQKQKQPSSGDDQQKQPQPTQGKMSRQQMNQLLEALNNEEKKTQEKVNASKVKVKVVKKEKDW